MGLKGKGYEIKVKRVKEIRYVVRYFQSEEGFSKLVLKTPEKIKLKRVVSNISSKRALEGR